MLLGCTVGETQNIGVGSGHSDALLHQAPHGSSNILALKYFSAYFNVINLKIEVHILSLILVDLVQRCIYSVKAILQLLLVHSCDPSRLLAFQNLSG